jgi:hypothetical protein
VSANAERWASERTSDFTRILSAINSCLNRFLRAACALAAPPRPPLITYAFAATPFLSVGNNKDAIIGRRPVALACSKCIWAASVAIPVHHGMNAGLTTLSPLLGNRLPHSEAVNHEA